MRRAASIAFTLLFLVASCSSGEDSAGGGGATDQQESSSSSVESTSTTVTPSTDAGDAGTFEIPQELLDRAEAKGFAVVDVDYPDQPDGVPWPTEQWERTDLPEGVDPAEVQRIVADAFANGEEGDTVDAIVVVYGGRIVLEAYNEWDPEALHNSWSMAKSITQSMVGMLDHEGQLDVFQPAQAQEWADPADPRHAITLDQLLRMSSGLEWEESYTDPEGDVLTILGEKGKADRAGYTAAKPLEAEPDTHWEYSTGTSDVIAREVAYEVGFGADYESWIQQNLFDPLGIPGAEHQFDEVGVTNGGSWINMRAEDFARFGLLYLRGGQWDGRRLFPETWVDYTRLPTPTSEKREYGAQWWLEEDPEFPEVFWASGYNGQSITVMPEQDVVIVVLSTTPDDRDLEVRGQLMQAFKGLKPPA